MAVPCPCAGQITTGVWGPADETIVTGHENGDVVTWDAKTGEARHRASPHKKTITDMQLSKDQTMVITASKDCTALVMDVDELKVLKHFATERPVNSAAISPLKPHVILGGGQDAAAVTTTSGKVGKFDARLFHLVFEEELGHIKGHFGPINTLAFHPDGKGYVSGGEDGYLRLHRFDDIYFELGM